MINADVSVKNIYKINIFSILTHVISVITCDEIREETKTVPTNFQEKSSL